MQRLAPDRPVQWTIDQEPESIFEPRIDGGQWQMAQAGSRQFDRQGQGIKRPADGDNVGSIVGGACEGARCGSRPLIQKAEDQVHDQVLHGHGGQIPTRPLPQCPGQCPERETDRRAAREDKRQALRGR